MRSIIVKMALIFQGLVGFSAIATTQSLRENPEAFLMSLFQYTHKNRIDTLSVSQRAEWFARLFADAKVPYAYLADPLGEGYAGSVDRDPLYRFDGFDCTTFIETVLALSLAQNETEFKDLMNQIRYEDGRISYESRNHFTSLEWIPNNQQLGFVRDISDQVAGSRVKIAKTFIERDEWFHRRELALGKTFSSVIANKGKEWSSLPYVSKEDLLSNTEILNRIPSGAIFNVVRPGWNLKKEIGTHLDISHQGILIREKGVLYMLHASNGRRDGAVNNKVVRRDRLDDYVRRVMMNSKSGVSMAGMNILAIGKP